MIYLQKPIDHPDGILDDILQHVPGVINATSSAIGLVADRFFPVCGGGPINQRADSSNGDSDKRVGHKRVRSPSSDTQDRPSVSGQAASNGPVQAKTKKIHVRQSRKVGSRKPRNGLLSRDASGKFRNVKSKPRDRPTEASSMDTTRTPATSEQVLQIVTEPVSPAAPPEDVAHAPSQVVEAASNQVVAPSTQPLVLDVTSPLIPSLTFPMPTAEELASFLYSTYIVPKLTENPSFFQCREQFYQKYYHAHLISFFQSNLGSTCISFSQVDTMIFAALRLLGFD